MKHCILAVDDEPLNLEIIEGFLDEELYEILMARDGEEAWRILEQSHDRIDVILLDRMMSGLDGIALAERILAHPGMRNIPIIMQSAAAQPKQISEGIGAGVAYYLTKPYTARQLRGLVADAVNGCLSEAAVYP